MFINDPTLGTPPDDTVIWRYMEFAKFVDVLSRQSLFFCRADLFSDTWEGSSPKSVLTDRDNVIQEALGLPGGLYSLPVSERERAQTEAAAVETYLGGALLPKLFQELRSAWCVNCWTMSDIESAALWRLYVPSGIGVAIRSTVGKLRSSLRDAGQPLAICAVKYINYETDEPPDNPIGMVMCKRRQFAYEQEIRVVARQAWQPAQQRQAGLYVPVRLETLVEHVVTAPEATPWFGEVVAATLKRWERTMRVASSSLRQEPSW